MRETGKRALEVAQAGFADTLSVELTVVLLYGKLKIGYAGRPHFCRDASRPTPLVPRRSGEACDRGCRVGEDVSVRRELSPLGDSRQKS